MQKNKKIYIMLFLFFLVGVIFGVFISVSTDSYVSLLTSKDKVFFDYVNGKVDFAKESNKLGLNFLIFQLLVFVLSLNFYSSLLSYVLVSYQSVILYLTLSAIVSQYGFEGLLKVVFIILPINLVILVLNILFAGFCIVRMIEARRRKIFNFGFNDKKFWIVIGLFVIGSLIYSYLVTLGLLVILKRRSYILF